MKRLIDIDLLNDEALQSDMAAGSMWILLVGTLFGVLGAAVLWHEPIGVLWFALLGVVSFLALFVHELVHALAFELMTGFSVRLRFGFSRGMLYTSAPGTILPRTKFCIVLLAPAVLVTAALGIGAASLGCPLLGWFLAVVHLSGCTGDLGYVRIIRSEPQATLVQDTEQGIALFHDD